MAAGKSYGGKCFCGNVALEVTGEPVAMGYCHCNSCREWSAGPIKLKIRDVLPKQKDVPTEMDGSGQLVAE